MRKSYFSQYGDDGIGFIFLNTSDTVIKITTYSILCDI